MRLIDADALGIGMCNPDVFPGENRFYAKGWNQAIEILQKAPTVDAVEVVRCKDCIYAQDSDDDDVQYNIGRICTCAVNEDYVSMRWADDFCSYGERRDDD